MGCGLLMPDHEHTNVELFQNKALHPSTTITTDTQHSLFHVSLSGLVLPAPDRRLTLGVGKLTVGNFHFINALFLLDLKYGGSVQRGSSSPPRPSARPRCLPCGGGARINHARTSVLITPNVAAPAKNPGDDLSLPVSLRH